MLGKKDDILSVTTKKQYSYSKHLSSMISSNILLSSQLEWAVLAQPQPPTVVPWIMEPLTTSVKTFGVVTKGSISYAIKVFDTHVSKGDALQVYFACRNNTTIVDIEYMEMTLWETFEWNVASIGRKNNRAATFLPVSSGSTRSARRILATQRITDLQTKMTKQRDMNDPLLRGFDIKEAHRRNQQELHIELGRTRNKHKIRVPEVRKEGNRCRLPLGLSFCSIHL